MLIGVTELFSLLGKGGLTEFRCSPRTTNTKRIDNLYLDLSQNHRKVEYYAVSPSSIPAIMIRDIKREEGIGEDRGRQYVALTLLRLYPATFIHDISETSVECKPRSY